MFTRSPLPLGLRFSPSLQANNLSCTGFGDRGFRLAYVHKDELVLVESKNGSGVDKTTKMEFKNTQVFSASYISFGSSRGRGPEYLIICSNLGAQLWSADGERMEWYTQLADLLGDVPRTAADGGSSAAGSADLQAHFLRGACGFQSVGGTNCVAIGSSIGTVFIFNAAGDVLHRLSTQSSSAVAATAASSQYLFAANDDGDVVGYRLASGFESFMRIPGRGDACTSLCCKEGVVVAGFVTGHVRVFRSEIGELTIETAAHSRSLSALALHPSAAYLATVSEDQCLRVWTCPDFKTPSGSDLDLGFAVRLEHCLCTGVAWAPDGRLLVANFDSEDLVQFHPAHLAGT